MSRASRGARRVGFGEGQVWRALLEPLVAYAFALVVLMCLTCAAFGTALNRIAFGRT